MITIDIRYKNTIYSLIVIAFLSFMTYAINKRGDDFNANIIILLTEIVGLTMTGLLVILRLFKYIRHKTNFLYNYFGTLNIWIAIFFLISGIVDTRFTLKSVIMLLIHCILGTIIMFDIYKGRKIA